MNELTVFSRDIIPVYTTDTGEHVVIGRELHERLNIGKDYSTWMKDMAGYGFSEGEDFSPISGKTSEAGGRPRIDHILKLEIRLTNKRRRMADEGICKSKRDKVNKLDVIGEDKKLIEIYMAIIREMAIKHGVSLDAAKTA